MYSMKGQSIQRNTYSDNGAVSESKHNRSWRHDISTKKETRECSDIMSVFEATKATAENVCYHIDI